MKLSASIRSSLLAAALSVAWPAVAQDMRFMSDTPYVHFTKEDHALFDAALAEALDNGADGQARTWSNPNSRTSGQIKPLKSFERNGNKCRRAFIANKAKGRSASGEYNLCKQASGKWMVVN
jgi:surface antigen